MDVPWSEERDALSQLLAVKDNMIWTLVEERTRLRRQVSGGEAEIESLKAALAAARSAQPVADANPAAAAAAATSAAAAAGAVAAGVEGVREEVGAPEAKETTSWDAPPPGSVRLVLNIAGQ